MQHKRGSSEAAISAHRHGAESTDASTRGTVPAHPLALSNEGSAHPSQGAQYNPADESRESDPESSTRTFRGRGRVRMQSVGGTVTDVGAGGQRDKATGGRNNIEGHPPKRVFDLNEDAENVDSGSGESSEMTLAERDARVRWEMEHPGRTYSAGTTSTDGARRRSGANIEAQTDKAAGTASDWKKESLGTDNEGKPGQAGLIKRSCISLKTHRLIVWIYPKITSFDAMKPVIRCAISAWIGVVLVLIYVVEATMGQAAFFAIIVAFISPPNLPFIQAMEQLFFLFLCVGLSWAWVVLGAWLSILARTNDVDPARLALSQEKYAGLASTNPSAYARAIIFNGTYIQAGPSVICIVFLAIGTAFFASIKIRTAPAPWTFGTVFACILADVSLTIVPLFPYPYYSSGLLLMLPMAVQAAIAVLCSIFVFPESVNSSFMTKLAGIMAPLDNAYADMLQLFTDVKDHGLHPNPAGEATEISLEIWTARAAETRKEFVNSAAGLGPANAQTPYLTRELSYGRLSGRDCRDVFALLQTLQLRSSGIIFFFDIIENAVKNNALDTKVFSVAKTHDMAHASHHPSPAGSRSSSPGAPVTTDDAAVRSDTVDSRGNRAYRPDDLTRGISENGKLQSRSNRPRFSHDYHDDGLNRSRVSLFEHFKRTQAPVGLYESVRYMNMERDSQADPQHLATQMQLLAESATPLLSGISRCVNQANHWLVDLNQSRSFRRILLPGLCKRSPESQKVMDRMKSDLADLRHALHEYRQLKRLSVVEPYLHLVDKSYPPSLGIDYEHLEHRGLYYDFLASYHLMEFAGVLISFMDKAIDLNETRQNNKLWLPEFSFSWKGFKRHTADDGTGDDPHNDEVLDDEISHWTIAQSKARDPDNEPYQRSGLNSLRFLSGIMQTLTGNQALFAIKAGLLTVCVSMPAFFASTADFFYSNRGLWVIVMAQLTYSMNVGDTTSAFLVRLQASFYGCLLGMVLWYIAEGSSHSQPYGLAAVTAVAFVPLMLVRIHAPVPPLTAILFVVSAGLVMGYSWLNGTLTQLTNASWGFSVAWRRFVNVVIGVTAAFIFALLPPRSSGKIAIRKAYSKTISQLGTIMCDVISQGLSPDFDQGLNTAPVKDNILAMRRKLAKLRLRHPSIAFEVSVKGRWPAARYLALHELLVDWSQLTSQLHHVLREMPFNYRLAVLERARLSDSQFLGDILAVISMTSTSLETGRPLPQVSPGPLIERLFLDHYGLDISHNPNLGLPSHVTAEVLKSEDYLRYALATTVTFSIIRRLDRLLLVTKTLCGETYHVDIDLEENYPLLKRHRRGISTHDDDSQHQF